jgi:ankyrin repeat protein
MDIPAQRHISSPLWCVACGVLVIAAGGYCLLEFVGFGKEPPRMPRFRDNPFNAAEHGELNSLKTQLTQDPETVHRTDSIGQTPLHYAAEGDQPQAIEFLAAHGADLDLRSHLGNTPLHVAAMTGSLASARTLIDLGADPLTWTKSRHEAAVEGATVLDIAAMRGYLELVRLLLEEHGAPVEYPDKPHKETPLHWACRGSIAVKYRKDPRTAGNGPVIDLLAKRMDDINIRDLHLRTPLLVAAGWGVPETIEHLLDNYPDVDINAQDGEGNTALHLAAFTSGIQIHAERRAPAIRILLKHGARTDIKNSAGQTPLEYARHHGNPTIINAFGKP